ncbi:uncharacterized protein LOC131005067 isoform X2 [Salvia miltiorrhiza]|uniref:uncharacterized protein LOC131005067 isoform X2 n=1 Tax=Salvia miltiorrhiza TaxID=226208 RepID=UPI0025AC7D20|nr:uncharacterized protein LOC131005067 isoform X2 [Salvia miltiorrhiza]
MKMPLRALDKVGSMERRINSTKASVIRIGKMIEKVHLEVNVYIEIKAIFGEIMGDQSVMIEELEQLTEELIDMEAIIPSVSVVDANVNFGFNRHPIFMAKLIHKTQAVTQQLSSTKALIQDIIRSINKKRGI